MPHWSDVQALLEIRSGTASNELASSVRYYGVSTGYPGHVPGTLPYRCFAWQKQEHRILGFLVLFHFVFAGTGVFRRHRIGKEEA